MKLEAKLVERNGSIESSVVTKRADGACLIEALAIIIEHIAGATRQAPESVSRDALFVLGVK